MSFKRILKHWLMTDRQARRTFPRSTLSAIEKKIKESETAHVGEIRFVVEGALDGWPLFKGQSARGRAIDVFSQLRVWDTEDNSGLLIYLLLADRAVEIVADRGIDAKVGAQEWSKICQQMEACFKQSNYEGGVIKGVQAVTRQLRTHFPTDGYNRNELPGLPVLL